MTELQKKKLSSRRFLIVVWACILVSVWGSIALATAKSPSWLVVAMNLLIAIPTLYVSITSVKKKEEVK